MERPLKLAEQVATAIKNDVVARGWPVGANLGSEAVLIAKYGVSRATLREAVGILEHTQLASMHRGRGGGLTVRQPAAHVVARTVAAHIHLAGISMDDLFDVRIHLQVLAAQLAAARMTEADVASLRALVQGPPPLDEHIEVALGRASGNPALALLIPTLTRVTGMRAGAPQGAKLDGRSAKSRLEAWRRIVDATVAGDTAALERRMRRSLDAERSWLEARSASIVPKLQDSESGKVSERIAEELAAEVRQRQPGEFLGNEAELLQRLGVTRAPLRQAIRILEHHGVVRMREGSTGGLMACAANPSEIVDALALYLHYIDADIHAIAEIRGALEVEAAGTAAGRPDIAVLLREGLPTPNEGSPTAFHTWVAQLAGNPLTTLLVRALIGATALKPDGTSGATPPASEETTESHRRVLEAIAEGDVSLARHRMRRDLAGCGAGKIARSSS